MKEPWKKPCNGKVIITLNDEKTEPTEVELPVDFNWNSQSSNQDNFSVSKIIVLLSFIIFFGFSIYGLWKVQKLETIVQEDRSYLDIIKHSFAGNPMNDPMVMIFEKDDSNKAPEMLKIVRAEPLIGAIDLNEASSQDDRKKNVYQDDKLDYLNSRQKSTENKETTLKDPVESKLLQQEFIGQNIENATENIPEKNKNTNRNSQQQGTEPEEWIKPLVDAFDMFGNHGMEDDFIHNILRKLLPSENNIEVIEFNKLPNMQERDQFIKRVIQEESPKKPQRSVENLIKTSFPRINNLDIVQFREKPESSAEDEMIRALPPFHIKQLPPFDHSFLRALLPNPMRAPDTRGQQKLDLPGDIDDGPKIHIQSIKLKLIPLSVMPEDYPKEEDVSQKYEMFQAMEPEQSQVSRNLPLVPSFMPVPNFMPKNLLPSRNFDMMPTVEKMAREEIPKQSEPAERFNLQDLIVKTLMSGPNEDFHGRIHMINALPEPEGEEAPQQPITENGDILMTEAPAQPSDNNQKDDAQTPRQARSTKLSPIDEPEKTE